MGSLISAKKPPAIELLSLLFHLLNSLASGGLLESVFTSACAWQWIIITSAGPFQPRWAGAEASKAMNFLEAV